MKNLHIVATSIVLATLSFGSFAAEQITRSQAENLDKMGTVSVDSAHSLSSLERKLAAKADAQGAGHYYIVSASDNDVMHGTAIIYK
ncbi:multiple stress resistance protein BhsA [Budvicia diplopodorum]|uniref:multiple stress resistance protein BhsA n=1 Tax=Budvicia diplopodorum TaxID=1119056 RepID=UPI001358532E|nr:YdgH/BhsA/McbA-like domain containing protein [Budvicia diplopodorum]